MPYTSTTAALTSLSEWHVRELYNPEGYALKAHFPIEIRWTEKDDVWLSPCYEQRGTFLGAIQYRFASLPFISRVLPLEQTDIDPLAQTLQSPCRLPNLVQHFRFPHHPARRSTSLGENPHPHSLSPRKDLSQIQRLHASTRTSRS